MELYESGENYLETILILKNRLESVRAIDIANEFGFSKPSVSNAIKKLKISGYITVDDGNNINLTPEGYNIAVKIHERHEFLCNFLIQLGVSREIAEKDACRMEHVISDESIRAMTNHCKICRQQKK